MAASAYDTRWIRKEAAMAAITFNAAHQKAQAQAQLKAALSAYHEMLDTFVHNRMPLAEAEAGPVPAWRVPSAQSESAKPQ
jgi:hypothetical protein